VIDLQKFNRENVEIIMSGLNWEYIARREFLPISFMEDFKDYLNWEYICQYQELKEEDIERFHDKVSWIKVSRNQILSQEFI
jgi:hypothetical protein